MAEYDNLKTVTSKKEAVLKKPGLFSLPSTKEQYNKDLKSIQKDRDQLQAMEKEINSPDYGDKLRERAVTEYNKKKDHSEERAKYLATLPKVGQEEFVSKEARATTVKEKWRDMQKVDVYLTACIRKARERERMSAKGKNWADGVLRDQDEFER